MDNYQWTMDNEEQETMRNERQFVPVEDSFCHCPLLRLLSFIVHCPLSIVH
ncbi:MAG: hypothetical protein FWF88_04325 [Peptococcaceae bacterium]|nr:hypothetical protein [Peptococcaceae bacterium]